MYLKTISLLTLLIFISCEENCDDAFLQTSFKTSQSYCIDDNTVLEVISFTDSRCPEGVTCGRAGDVQIKYLLKENGVEKKDSTLVQAKSPTKDTIFGKYVINISDVTPYPKKDAIINLKDYRIIAKITK
jgi:hypothetical protein